MSPSYHNRDPAQYQREQEAARRAQVAPVEVPSDAFDAFAAVGTRMIFVVSGEGKLVVARRRQRGEHISHAVLAGGGSVLAAGEFEVGFDGSSKVVSELNNMSGHYRPSADSLAVAAEAFEAAGIRVLPDAVTPYDFGAP